MRAPERFERRWRVIANRPSAINSCGRFLRRGNLEVKQQQNAKASADFDTAEQLYRAEAAEGLTE